MTHDDRRIGESDRTALRGEINALDEECAAAWSHIRPDAARAGRIKDLREG